jgi:hypothetical protein
MAEFSSYPDSRQRNSRSIEQLAVGNVIKLNLIFESGSGSSAKVWDEHGAAVSLETRLFHNPDAPIPTGDSIASSRAAAGGWAGGPAADSLRGEGALVDQAVIRCRSSLILRSAEIQRQLQARTFMIGTMIPSAVAPTAMFREMASRRSSYSHSHSTTNYFLRAKLPAPATSGRFHGAIQSGQRAAPGSLNTESR